MSFDYGSIDLGLKNPFKFEGKITALRGLIQSGIGIYLLMDAASTVKESSVSGWIMMVFGLVILLSGIRALSGGTYALLRYFIGRNHPTSLAKNYSKSERSTSNEEESYVHYTASEIEEMLMGRKNTTFKEPKGILTRMLYSFAHRLLYMPYPIRNMAQSIFEAWVKTFASLVLYGFISFVLISGFAGDVGVLTFPIYSIFLLLYLLRVWSEASKPIDRNVRNITDEFGAKSIAKMIALSIVVPVFIALVIEGVMKKYHLSKEQIEAFAASMPDLYIAYYIGAMLLLAAVITLIVVTLLKKRIAYNDPVVEVSELRENWQESVHPNEIFINLDNLVMANRRYKEVPNRVYRELEPLLNEHVAGKGDFYGEMIQEVQPKVKEMHMGSTFNFLRGVALIAGNLLYVLATLSFFYFAYSVIDIYSHMSSDGLKSLKETVSGIYMDKYLNLFVFSLHLFMIGIILKSFGRLLANVAHIFFAEIQFESLLVYFKIEGTFTESKISTGTAIYDSTQSENTLVRSSITTWAIVSRIVTTTFAATGMRNLEYPRYILEMHKDDAQLNEIKDDIIRFLKDRESIAAITSVRDLNNASQIHQLNKQTKLTASAEEQIEHVEAAALENKKDTL